MVKAVAFTQDGDGDTEGEVADDGDNTPTLILAPKRRRLKVAADEFVNSPSKRKVSTKKNRLSPCALSGRADPRTVARRYGRVLNLQERRVFQNTLQNRSQPC